MRHDWPQTSPGASDQIGVHILRDYKGSLNIQHQPAARTLILGARASRPR